MTGIFMYTLFVINLPNFSSIGWFLFSSTFISCHQLLTANDSLYEKKYWNFFVHTKVDTCAEFQLSRLIFIFISCLSAVISCWQQLTADDSWYEKKNYWNFYVHTKVDTCVKFQLSRLIFILSAVINCPQLLTADDSWCEQKFDWIFYVHT